MSLKSDQLELGFMSSFVLFESNNNVPVNILSLLTELRCSPCVYVKQTSKEISRGKECLISRSSTGGV